MTLLRATRYAGLALLLWIAPALAQTNLGQIPPGTVVGNPTSANAFPSAVPLASLGLGFSVMAYGADPSGSADSTSAFQQAIAAASAAAPATVTIPCGNYRLTPGVLTINTNNVSIMGQSQNCVNLNRYADTGALISFGKATAYLFSTTVSGFTINDIAAQTNVTGYSTCANSPYQLVFDGMNGLQLSNVRVNFGCGAFAFRAVIFSWVTNVSAATAPVAMAPSENNLGIMMYVGVSPKGMTTTPVIAPQSSNIFFDGIDLEAGANPTVVPVIVAKAAVGLRIDGCDGCWSRNGHIQGAGTANMHLAHNGWMAGTMMYAPMSNIEFTGWMWDITPGTGILFDGVKQISNSKFAGRVTAAALYPSNAFHGITISSSGCLSNAEFAVAVDGFGGGGIVSTAQNCVNIAIRIQGAIVSNGWAGHAPGIKFTDANGLTISGGTIGGDATSSIGIAPNIFLGGGPENVQNATIAGVNAGNAPSSSFGIVIAAGVQSTMIAGNNLVGPTPISDSSTLGQTFYSGNYGLVDYPWVTVKGYAEIIKDDTDGLHPQQIQIQSVSNTSNVFDIGLNTSSNFASLAAAGSSAYFPIFLNRGAAAAAGGVAIGNPTGGDKGAGTLNVATNIYLNGAAYTNPDYVLERYFTGAIKRYADNPGAEHYGGLMPLDDVYTYMQAHLRLPGITDETAGVVERFDLVLAKIEELTLYTIQLHERIKALEGSRKTRNAKR